MKVLLIIHSVSWKGGGAFFHALHIAQKLSSTGNQVSIMATSPVNRFSVTIKEVDGIQLIEFPDLLAGTARNGWDPWNTFRRLIFLLNRKRKYDIVHCLDCRPVVIFPGLFMKYAKRSKLILEWLDWFGRGGTASERSPGIRFFMEPVETFFEEKFRKFADGTIGLGHPLTERARKMGIKTKMLTIPHGCDISNVQNIPIPDARLKVRLDESNYYIGYSGRLREDSASLFISTIVQLRTLYSLNVHGIFIGNSAFNLDKFLNKENESYIHRTGWIDYETINYFLCSCNILLLPFGNSVARNNIWPSKINDYLSASRPIVSTNLEVLKELFINDAIGIMCEADSKKIADACNKILLDPEKAGIMGKHARKLAEEKYEWSMICKEIETFYQEVILLKS